MSTSFKTLRANRPSLAARDPRCNEVSVVAIYRASLRVSPTVQQDGLSLADC